MNLCELYRFGVVNEDVNNMEKDKIKIEEQKGGVPRYSPSVPFQVRVASLEFATKCCEMGLIGRSSDDVISFAEKVVNNYFKY